MTGEVLSEGYTTQTTSWDRVVASPVPGSSAGSSDVDPAASQGKTAAADEAKKKSSEARAEVREAPLPQGWEQKITAAGKVYYVNHIMKATQWKRPGASLVGKSSSVDSAAAINSEEWRPLPLGWEQGRTPSGEVYYIDHNTKSTTWERPVASSIEDYSSTASPSVASPQQPLPEGWEQGRTPSGEVYYIDHNTETTTWERPVASPVEDYSSGTISVASPQRWEQGSFRRQYLIADNTETTTWDWSVASSIEDYSSATPSVASPQQPLPEGWEAKPGPDGQTVYINHVAKTTQWERPTVEQPTLGPSGNESSDNLPEAAARAKRENVDETSPTGGVDEPLAEGGHVDAKRQVGIMKGKYTKEHSQSPKHSQNESKAGDPFSEQSISKEPDGPRMFEENEAVLAERLGTQAATFFNSSFGVELILEENSLEQNINAKVVVKPEIRLVKCSRDRDTSRTHDEMLTQGLEHGFGELDESLELLAMPIVHGPSEAKFNDDRPARLRFFAGYMEELQNDIQQESEDNFCRNKMEEYLRKEYEPLISPDGENWRMLPPFNVVLKNYNGRTTEVWLETRLYHFSMGSIGKVLRKQPDFRFFEGFMPWRMRFFGRRHEVIFGNATEDDLVYYACKKIDVVANRRRNEVEAGYMGAYGKVAIEDDISMVNHGIDHVMKHKVDRGTYRTVEMFKDGKTVQDQMLFAVFLPKATSLIFLEKDLLSKRKMYVVLPKMIARWRDGAEPTDEEKLARTATITEVKNFLGKY